ncbi:MAG: hypothetical protein JST31_14915 [Actinobacteria bacterium]|nr:hypothetical protein [Actinomycetota bacterium]
MSARRAVIAIAVALSLLFAAQAHAFVYWADSSSGTIGRANNDGSGANDAFINVGGQPNSVAVDSGHIYWANGATGSVGRANLDGSGVNNAFITGIKVPNGVAVNATSIYWSSIGANEIGRANLDGTAPNLALVTGALGPCGVAVDSGHVYWVGLGSSSGYVGRASLTGNSPQPEWVPITFTGHCGIAVNSANVFWANTGFLSGHLHEIGRVNLFTGENPDPSMIGDANGPCGVAVDATHIYWANSGSGTIGRANTDATGVNESFIATGGGEICGVAVDGLAPPAPAPGAPQPPAPTPAPAASLRLLRTVLDPQRGTARLTFRLSTRGKLTVTGLGVHTVTVRSKRAGKVTVTLRPKQKLSTELAKGGQAKARITARFVPLAGTAVTLARTVRLVEKHTR